MAHNAGFSLSWVVSLQEALEPEDTLLLFSRNLRVRLGLAWAARTWLLSLTGFPMTSPSPSGWGVPEVEMESAQPWQGPHQDHRGAMCSLVGGGPRNMPQIETTLGGKASLWFHRHHMPLELQTSPLGLSSCRLQEKSPPVGMGSICPFQQMPLLTGTALCRVLTSPRARVEMTAVIDVITPGTALASGREAWLLLLPQIFNS